MLSRLKQRFLDWPLAKKFVSVFVVLTIVSSALMVFVLHIGLSVFQEKLYDRSLQELDFFVQRMDDELTAMDDLTRTIAVDSSIQQQLTTLAATNPGTAEYYSLLTRTRPLLLEQMYHGGQTDCMQFTDLYGHTITLGMAMPEPDEEHKQVIIDRLEQVAGGFAVQSPDTEYPYFICGRNILCIKDMSLRKLGTILISVDVAKLLDNQIQSLSSQPSELYLYNGTEVVYHSGDEDAVAFSVSDTAQGYKVASQNGRKYFICWLTSKTTDLRLCSVFDYNQIYAQTNLARLALVVGECAILLLFGWIMLKIARLVTHPIHVLSEAVQTVETGDFTAARAMLPNHTADDEVGTLTREFDVMLEQIDTLIHENYEKQILLQETRYKMLQAQINPHFLYNTLNTLSWLVQAGKNEDASDLIVYLGDMLRAAFSPKQTTTAAADVQLAQSYIEIQKMRYKRRAKITLTAQGDLDHWYLPHFTLQPLVENAIHYGVESSAAVCTVDVSAVAEGDTLTLRVQNSGAVIPPDKLAEIQNFTVKPQGHGIGLKNIYERLALLYGKFEFTFTNSAEDGTTVLIVLNHKEQKEDHSNGKTADR